MKKLSAVMLCFLMAVSGLAAEEPTKVATPEVKKWEAHDLTRPKPEVRTPGAPTDAEFAKPPEGAIILFDGTDLSKWERHPNPKEQPPVKEPKWKVGDGYFEVVANSGNIYTTEKFGDCRIHIEWATPSEYKPNAKGQNRGNSGLFLPGHNELQILDSYENETYADGQAAAVYGKHPPALNVCRKPGEWQSYDITLEQSRFDEKRKLIKPATLTVVHNGILVQDHVPLDGNSNAGTLGIQDHYTPVRFRNIWVQKMEPEPKK
jgi:hypothetical protein